MVLSHSGNDFVAKSYKMFSQPKAGVKRVMGQFILA